MKSIRRFLLSAFCLLLAAYCFGQTRPPQDASHFVYQTSLSLGYGVGKHYIFSDTLTNENLSFEVQQILAYQFTNSFFTGMGAGLDFWFYDKEVSTFIPMFANATVKFMNKKTAPFLFANFGYAFKWQTAQKVDVPIFYGTKAGIYFQSGLGCNVKFSEKLSLLLSAYYKLQQSAIKYRGKVIEQQLFHFAGIKIGLLY